MDFGDLPSHTPGNSAKFALGSWSRPPPGQTLLEIGFTPLVAPARAVTLRFQHNFEVEGGNGTAVWDTSACFDSPSFRHRAGRQNGSLRLV
jgi:hypothetical protein